jgi:lipopolysaccharide export LptBFGC system permease protein LptF
MSGKRIALSFGLGLAAGLCAYFVAWGFFTTHPELGMAPGTARTIAIWVSSIGFLASLLYFAVRKRPR